MNKRLLLFILIISLVICSFSFADIISAKEPNIIDNEYVDEEMPMDAPDNGLVNEEEITNNSDLTKGHNLVIQDDANLLTEEQIEVLRTYMTPLTEYGNIVFKTTNYNPTTPKQYAHDCYYDMFGEQSGSLFLIDMQNRYLFIHSDGTNYKKYITTAKANSITDNIYTEALKGDYLSCAMQAFSQMNTILSGGKISEPMRLYSSFLISIVSSAVLSFGYIMMCSKNKKPSTDKIISNCKVKFNTNNTKAIKIGQSKKYSPQSDGGGSYRGGGGGGHGSHGSHGSGGGGGHGF